MCKVKRVFVQSQSFNPCNNSKVHRIRRVDFAREFCFCRNFRENRQTNWGFAATRLEFHSYQSKMYTGEGDGSFRTISVVQSVQQQSAPNSKSRFRSRIWLYCLHRAANNNPRENPIIGSDLTFPCQGALQGAICPRVCQTIPVVQPLRVATGTPYIKRLQVTFRNVGYPHFGTWHVV